MLLANEAVGGLLARAKRPALYRVHEHPKHEALLALADRLTALGLPVAPLPERANGPEASRAVARQSELLEPIVRQRPATREPFGALLLRTLQLARYDPVNIGHAALCVAGLRALHVADPPLSRHRRAPRGVRARGPRRGGAEGPRPARGRAALLAARARGGRCRAPRRRDLPGVPAPGHAAPRRLAPELRRRRHGPHRRRAVRALRRDLRGLPAGAAARRPRALRHRRARRGARRPQLRAGASASATSSRSS